MLVRSVSAGASCRFKLSLLVAFLVTGLVPGDRIAVAGEKSFDCMVRHLRVNAERFYVRCHSNWSGLEIPAYVRTLQYYSVPYSQQNARYLFDLIMDARSRGKALQLIFEDDPAANPPGCRENNCRRIIAVGVDD